jgi:hypothetical protein
MIASATHRTIDATVVIESAMCRFRKSRNFIFWLLIVVNVPGIASYIFLASWLWTPPGQEGPYHDARGELLWGVGVFPFLAICSLVNFIASRSVLIHLFLYRDYRLFSLWLFIVVIWFGAVKYDLGRHFADDHVTKQESANP